MRLVTALSDVSISLDAGTSSALTGESGSGKTTLARCLASIEKPDSGQVYFEGIELTGNPPRNHKEKRRKIQLIVQTTAAALNPWFSVLELVQEPLVIRGGIARKERKERAIATLERVGLSSDFQHHRAGEMSGGQKQRVAVARALLTDAQIFIFDEAFAGLDVRSTTNLMGLLVDLQQSFKLTYLFISHDLRPLAGSVSRTLLMHRGHLVQSS